MSTTTIELAAGSIAGTAQVLASHPFDTLKVKMQSFPTKYNSSVITCFKSTLSSEKISGFYRGSIPSILCNAGENAVLFLCYDVVKKIISPSTTPGFAICGSISAFFSSIVVCPTELIKCRLQAARETGIRHETTIKLILRTALERGSIFQGMTSTWLREVPGYFFFFYGKELTRNLNVVNDNLKTVISGLLAGIFYWTVMLPVDNVKTRMQVQNSKERFTAIFKQTYETNPKLFYSGFSVTMLRAIPANIALFYAYENSKLFLNSL